MRSKENRAAKCNTVMKSFIHRKSQYMKWYFYLCVSVEHLSGQRSVLILFDTKVSIPVLKEMRKNYFKISASKLVRH